MNTGLNSAKICINRAAGSSGTGTTLTGTGTTLTGTGTSPSLSVGTGTPFKGFCPENVEF